MHTLVQLATRTWLEASGQLEKWKQQYFKSLSAAFPTGKYENWTKCQALFPNAKSAITQRPRAEETLWEWALLLFNTAWYAWRKGNIIEAATLSEKAMKVIKKILGRKHKETLRSMKTIGLTYSLEGQWDNAEEIYRQALTLREWVLGKEHSDTLGSVYCLAYLLYQRK